jgi:hypothetical protein
MNNLTDTEKIKNFIDHEYPGSANKALRDFVSELWGNFQKYNLQDNIFASEFTNGCRKQSLERYSEMLFAWHFTQTGFLPTSKNEGPDLCIEHRGRKIWIEIITPRLEPPLGKTIEAQKAAKAIEDYLTPLRLGEVRTISIPNEQILLRWTAALKEKREKLTGCTKNGKNVLGYLKNKIVQPGDVYVIAINSISLGRHGFHGISQYPNPVEATFAVGPIEMTINCATLETISTKPSFRPELINHNQSTVPADSFLNPCYKEVSALIATHADLGFPGQSNFAYPCVLVHNPYASNPLPQKIFGALEEYVAENRGTHWEIRNIVND